MHRVPLALDQKTRIARRCSRDRALPALKSIFNLIHHRKGSTMTLTPTLHAGVRIGTLACAALAFSSVSMATPVPLPDPGIKGYKFPEAKDTLMGWINKDQAAPINLHGWGLWTSLTMPSGQSEFGMPNVPVYLTWLSPAEIADLPPITPGAAIETRAAPPKRVFKLERPRQFSHGSASVPTAPEAASNAREPASAVKRDTSIFVTVGYDPAAQAWAQQNQLFSVKSLQAIYDAGTGDIRSIPSFPARSVTTKPTYKVITKAKLNGSIYTMPAWPGTPQTVTPKITQRGFPEPDWPGCVYVDVKNIGSTTASAIDADCKTGPKPTNTYGLGDFVSFPVTADNISSFDKLLGDSSLEVGDVVLLMAMHVTSREIDEWTWQTYFWTPNPANPPLPSSSAIAKARPPQLKGAAAHYAMSIGYQMVTPNQPAVGGKSVGYPVTAFNPYLESGFNAKTFGSPPVNPGILAPGTQKLYRATVGIQSNCMTCHGAATLSPTNPPASLPYLTDFYLSRTDPAFKGYLQLDFLWSIQGNAK
jgi:hypothetical protein